MTVLHLWHSSGWRGGENQFRLLATHLAPSWQGHLGAPPGSQLMQRMAGVLPAHPMRCNGLLDFGSIARARQLIVQHGFKLIHAHDSHALSTALSIRMLTKTRVVASRRNAYAIRSGWKYRAADAFFCVSEAAARELSRAGVAEERLAIVPDAVDLDALDSSQPERLEADPSDIVVLCVAAFSAEKDHRTLLAAWQQVEARCGEAWLHLAGSGSLETELRELSASLGLQRVRFLGWREDVPALIKGADVVVLSSRSEGLGSSLCEAQAAGKPVVATRAGGIPEAVDEGVTGLLSPVGEPSSLSDNLAGLIADPERRVSMGEAGRKRARTLFSPSAVTHAHQALYESLLSGRFA